MDLLSLARPSRHRSSRVSSYDVSGRNDDYFVLAPGEARVLADIDGPGIITHLWLTQPAHYRECLLKFTWDDAASPSVLCPLGDFFGLGHGIVNSYQSLLFTASTNENNKFNAGCALNCYAPMPFRQRAKIELLNESNERHIQYFYIDYDAVDDAHELDSLDYFHAEFRRAYPFCGWSPIANLARDAWDNNYVILDTHGRGRYIGCNLSVTNFEGGWWGEGDDMIWVDGYKWPPDLHGTGSEDYFNQAWAMQPNAFLRNGSSIWEEYTGGYQTCYVHHLENPVHFNREIRVTIEHNHANRSNNEFSSVAYWYAGEPTAVVAPPPLAQRLPVRKVDNQWQMETSAFWPGNGEPGRWIDTMAESKRHFDIKWFGQFVSVWQVSQVFPNATLADARPVTLDDPLGWHTIDCTPKPPKRYQYVWALRVTEQPYDGMLYMANRFQVDEAGSWELHLGHDGGMAFFLDGQLLDTDPEHYNPAPVFRNKYTLDLTAGIHEIVLALDYDRQCNNNLGIFFAFMPVDQLRAERYPARVED